MSSIYSTEPPTKGKVVLHTSFGDLDVELWAKEAPKAVRNFVQLCLEGYYDGTSFHRLIKNYILQGGDATGTGTGGESVYGKPFRDEVHSRLRFTHRGLLACAGETAGDAVVPDSNRSQFFITLDPTQQLDRKHTIFGKIAGDTIFNLTDLNELEVDEYDVPAIKLTIHDAEVLWNPFDDLQPRVDKEEKKAAREEAEALAKVREQKAAAAAKAAMKQQNKRNATLLSFDEEEEAGEDAVGKAKIRSYHDAVEDKRFIRDDAVEAEAVRQREAEAAAERQRVAVSVSRTLTKQGGEPSAAGTAVAKDQAPSDQPDFAAEMRAKAQSKRKAAVPAAVPAAKRQRDSDSEGDESEEEERPKMSNRAAALAASTSRPAELLISKRVKVADADLLTDWQRKNKEYKQRHQLNAHRESDTMARLMKFRQHLQAPKPEVKAKPETSPSTEDGDNGGGKEEAGTSATADTTGAADTKKTQEDEAYAGKVRTDIDHNAYKPAAWRVDSYLDEPDEEDLVGSLRSHRLVFSKDNGAVDAMARQEKLDDYKVLDPLAQSGSQSKPFKKTLRSDLSGGPLM
ncbi:hypothetical protein ABBQ32_002946 [Trebouxia sp. C0010 RCD-2024]